MGKVPLIKSPLIAALVVTLGSVTMGSILSFASPTQEQITNEFHFTDTQQVLFNVCAHICAVFGAPFINVFLPMIGRKKGCFLTGALAFIAFVILGRSKKLWLLFLMRCIAGLTIGFGSTICPSYICELAPLEKRGLYGYINQLLTSVGFMLPSLFGFTKDWRLNSSLCAIPSGILCILIVFTPDSSVSGKAPPFVTLGKHPKQILVSLALMFFLQFSGVQAIISNLQGIIEKAGMDVDSRIISVVANLSQVLTTALAAFVVDRWGRQFCWELSSAGQLLAFILLTVYKLANTNPALFLVGLFAEQLFYGIGTGPIPFLRAAELFPDDVRATAMGVLTSANWLITTIVVFVWPYMEKGLGLGYSFLFYACIQILAMIFGIFVFPKSSISEENSKVNSSLHIVDKEPSSIDYSESEKKEEDILEENIDERIL
ncbi:major facilitator superfamily transporter [Tritrichomonas foetus]|uniref:Major facilitator superfamily transporter n=1 Tax=Tritrichomonas foetus TaxID=1144522 RepID=A0A1J4L0A6_9EUKA|nr:major facilitator superfamily transporter [Tritrichomonas foetus]|eukprot:OHT16945.1 major facilitator superfamily transporter [Tritrichomonas foetus]